MPLLDVKQLNVSLPSRGMTVLAVRNLDLEIHEGEAVALVGESGCGKSRTALSLLGLHEKTAEVSGSIRLGAEELIGQSQAAMSRLRGQQVAMIFQDALSALNPYLRVETQMTESLQHHAGIDHATARARALQMLDAVQLPDAARCLRAYPHQLSGGMRQRVLIAMALMCEPKLLVADEPTTALDVTVQAEIVQLLDQLRRDMNLALLFITHDLGLVAKLCDRVLVMYAGEIIEQADTAALFRDPRHPYTRALLSCMPRLDTPRGKLSAISGQPPRMVATPAACPFAPRCPDCFEPCRNAAPSLEPINDKRQVACFKESTS